MNDISNSNFHCVFKLILMQTTAHKGRYISPSERVNIVQCFCTILSDSNGTIAEQQTVANMQANFAQICEPFYTYTLYTYTRVASTISVCVRRVSFDCVCCVHLGVQLWVQHYEKSSRLISSIWRIVMFGTMLWGSSKRAVITTTTNAKAQKSTVRFLWKLIFVWFLVRYVVCQWWLWARDCIEVINVDVCVCVRLVRV